MNDSAFDRMARAYIADGPDALADRVLAAAVERARRTPQQRSAFARVSARSGVLRLSAGSLTVAAVVLVALLAVPGAGPGAVVVAPVAAAPIRVVWTTNDDVVAYAVVRPAVDPVPYLAAAVYDRFDGSAWALGRSRTEQRDAGEPLRAEADGPGDPTARQLLDLTVTPTDPAPFVLWTGVPVRVDTPVSVDLATGGDPVGIHRDESTARYTVTTLVPSREADGGPTPARLRAAGTTYPSGLLERYGSGSDPQPAFVTAQARALLDEIVATGGQDPYDLAKAAERLFREPNRFMYDTDLRGTDCGRLGVVDCLAVHRRGFCQYFATAMAVLLRELDIPTRYVQGFLPGTKDASGTVNTVRNSDSHAWVQVYFPRYGWIDFDPTPGGIRQLAPLPSGG